MFGGHENYLFQNEKNVVLNEKSVEGKPCTNRESKRLNLTIQLYSCYDEHEAPRSYNTTVYLSNLILLLLSNLFYQILSTQICLLWSDSIQSNILTSIWYTHSDMIWLFLLCSLQYNPICSLALPCSALYKPLIGTSNFA